MELDASHYRRRQSKAFEIVVGVTGTMEFKNRGMKIKKRVTSNPLLPIVK